MQTLRQRRILDHMRASQRVTNPPYSLIDWVTLIAASVIIGMLVALVIDAIAYRVEIRELQHQIQEAVITSGPSCRVSVVDGVKVEHCIRKAGF